MELVSFWYDRTDSSPEKIRFVAVKTSDNVYVHGWDMESGNYKTFLRSKIHGPIASYGFESESVLRNGSVVDTDALLKELNYTAGERAVAKQLATSKGIAELYGEKTGNKVLALANDYFFKYGPVSVDINLQVDGNAVTMRISEGVIEYVRPDGTKITLLDFTRIILGITS